MTSKIGRLSRRRGRANAEVGQALERERAYNTIRKKIILLELAPGVVLNEHELMETLAISRTPIREALLRLATEGFVRIMPRRGMIVSEMSLFELQQVYEGRTVLEPSSTRLAAQRASRAEVVALGETLDRADELLEARDLRGLLEADEAFHLGLVRAAQNKYLVDTIQTLHALAARFWFLSLLRLPLDVIRDQMRGHRKVLEAVVAGDPFASESAMRALISRFPKDLEGLLAGPVSIPPIADMVETWNAGFPPRGSQL